MSIALHLLAGVLAYSPPSQNSVEKDTRELLSDERYDFCDEDSGYLPYGDDRAWCGLVGRENRRCPGYWELCNEQWGGSGEYVAGGGGEGVQRERRDRKGVFNKGAGGDDPKEKPAQVQINREMSAFSKALLWALALFGIGMLIFSIFRSGKTSGADEEEEAKKTGALVPELSPGDAHRRVIETDVSRLLDRARQAASRGEYKAAIDDAYAALLRRLDGDGLIDIERHRTNGDYVRDLRERPDLRQEVRDIVRDVERVQFGRLEPSESHFRRVLDRVVPLVGRSLVSLLLAIGLGTGLSGCDYEDEHAGLAGLGTDPMGGRALVQLLRRADIHSHHRTRTIEQLRETHGALVLFGNVQPTEDEWDELIDWADGGGTLVLATGRTDLSSRLGIEVRAHGLSAEDDTYLSFVGAQEYLYSDLVIRAPRYASINITGDRFRVQQMMVRDLAIDEEVDPDYYDPFDGYAKPNEIYAVRITQGEGNIYVFADEFLFTNASMAVEDNAYFLVDLLSEFGGDIELVDEWTGTGAQNPLQSIKNSRLTPVILQILAFMVLLYSWRGIAFGRLRDPITRGRRAFVDHVHALALQYAKARASRHVLATYSAWVIDQLRARLAPGTGKSLHRLAQAVAARTGQDEAEVMRVLVEAHSVRESSAGASGVYAARRHDLDLMRRLTKLLTLSTRTRKKR